MLADVEAMRAVWLTQLPAAATLACSVECSDGQPRELYVTTSRAVFAAAQQARCAVLNGDGWLDLADAAAAGRAALALGDWASHPSRGLADALGYVRSRAERSADLAACTLSVADVLAHFRAALVALDPTTEHIAAQRAVARGGF